ncbi:MAG TPA: ABC transporter permease [Candidatus Acidoferrales bacterium]|nr:ABC transporter permease [Candidatus Acidoferrales bacterium]
MSALLQDVKYGLRMLRKSPGFTAIAILTLALSIGANTAIFSFTDQVVLRTLPVPNPQQLVVLRAPGPNPGRTSSDISDNAQIFSYPMYKDLRERSSVFSGLLACFGVDANVSGHGTTESASGELVSGNYFQTLEVQAALGRVFDANDETAPGANPVAVLSYGYWTRKFGADPSILDKPLTVNGTALTVVGVSRKGFDGVQIGSLPDIFIPISMLKQMAPTSGLDLGRRTDHFLAILGRLKPRVSRTQAQASLQPIFAPLLEEDMKALKMSSTSPRRKQFLEKPLLLADGAEGRQVLQPSAEEPLFVLLGMVGLVLLIACANLASLLVARGEARRREIAVRLALGAGRATLVRQLLAESLIISAVGGVAGVVMASWWLNTMVAAIPADTGMTGLTAALDPRVLWFAAAVTILTGILFGLAPALRATRVNLQSTLKDQGSSVSEGRSNIRLRKVLIVSQVALTAVLLAGAGLLARTLTNLEHANLGVRTENILQFSVEPDLNGEKPAQTAAFGDQARQAIAALPGVRSVTASAEEMFANDDEGFNITPEGYAVRPDEDTNVLDSYISPNYFSTMGISLVAGREFTDTDTATSQKVIVINQALARRFFAGRNPIGMHIARGGGINVHPDMEIVGVVADSKWDSPRANIVPFLYEPYRQDPGLGTLVFYVRTERDPARMAATLRGTIERLDANLPINDMRPLTEQISDEMFSDRLVAVLSISMALLAALLAALGLYGVLAYVVARRTREIGIRMALGGQRWDILGLVLSQGAQLTVIGGVIGIGAALGLTWLASSLFFGVSARDPLTFVAVGILLILVSGAACYLPARRAVRVDPMVALRYE